MKKILAFVAVLLPVMVFAQSASMMAMAQAELQKDSDNNGAVGRVELHECKDCVIHAEGLKRVVLQGLEGFIVSEKNGQLLVCKRSEEQRIKEFSSAQ